jgi:hypothetical protein
MRANDLHPGHLRSPCMRALPLEQANRLRARADTARERAFEGTTKIGLKLLMGAPPI